MKTAEELQKELDAANAANAENIKALQKKLTDNDVALKKSQTELAEATKSLEAAKAGTTGDVAELIKQISTLTVSVQTLSNDKATADLLQKYPDVSPKLLLGKSAEEQEILVTEQRAMTKKHYGDLPSPHVPKYKDINEVDERIKAVKADKNLSAEAKMIEIRELKEAKADLDNV